MVSNLRDLFGGQFNGETVDDPQQTMPVMPLELSRAWIIPWDAAESLCSFSARRPAATGLAWLDPLWVSPVKRTITGNGLSDRQWP